MKILIRTLQVAMAVLLIASETTFAQTVEEENQAAREKFHAALKACGDKFGRPERGQRPSEEFMDCMKKAGVGRPPGPPPDREGRPRPPRENQTSQTASGSQQ